MFALATDKLICNFNVGADTALCISCEPRLTALALETAAVIGAILAVFSLVCLANPISAFYPCFT